MDSKHQTKWLWFWQCGKQASVLLDVQVTLPPPRSGVWGAAIYFFLTRNQEMYCICVHCINLAKPEQRTFNGILHILLIKTKSCRLKPINHERWDLMDFWVNVYYHCNSKIFLEKLTSSRSSRTDAFQQGLNGFQYILRPRPNVRLFMRWTNLVS